MLTPLKFSELGKSDLIPQAIIRKPISYFEKEGRGYFVHDHDALDVFDGVAFLLDGLPFALMHHRGSPADETTVYLTRDSTADIDTLTDSIRHILAALQLPSESLVWQRKDDPEL